MVWVENMWCSFFSFLKLILIFGFILGVKESGLTQIKMSMGGDSLIHHSALLELESTDKGILIPRMDSLSRLNIQSPANGLLVYDTTFNDFYFFNGQNWNSLKQVSALDFHASINNPVCHGDSIRFKVISEDHDDFWWETPTNDTLYFEDSTFIVQNNTLISGLYVANFQKNNIIYKKYQWVTIEKCRIKSSDDIIVYSDNFKLHKITTNDHDNNNVKRIKKINNQVVTSNSTVFVGENLELAIRVNPEENGIYVRPESNINKIIQFSYEVCDDNNYCDTSDVTVYVNKTPNHLYISKDSFYNLVNQANHGDTLDLQFRTIMVGGSPLDIEKSVAIKNLIIKRTCTKLGTNAETINPGQNFIVMNTPHEFTIGEWILPVFGNGVDQNSGGQILQITDIIEDTIYIHQNFLNEVEAGSNVINRAPLVRIVHDSLSCVFENVVFDGSKGCNNFTYDWKFNQTITINENDSIKNCVFINTPSENIYMCGGLIKDCRAYNLNGSFVHASCGIQNPPVSFIENNYTQGVCLISVSQNGHNEGWFTYSANTRNFNATNNYSENGGESCFGSQELDDYNNTFTNNTFINFKNKKNYTEPGHPNPDNINNNTYINVPD